MQTLNGSECFQNNFNTAALIEKNIINYYYYYEAITLFLSLIICILMKFMD